MPRYNKKGELTFVSKKTVVREYDLVFIDECSMIETTDYESFTKMEFKKIYIGDECQLPPIGEKESPVFSNVKNFQRMSKIIRSNNDDIKSFNKDIRKFLIKGVVPELISNDNVKFINLDVDFKKCIMENFDQDSIILSYTNNRVKSYNLLIRKQKFPQSTDLYNSDEKIVFKEPHETFHSNQECVVSKVNVENRKHSNGFVYKVYSLKIGNNILYRVHEDDEQRYIGLFSQLYKTMKLSGTKEWEQYHKSKYEFLPPIEYGYSQTVHKSQGSTYKNVFIDLDNIEDIANKFDIDFERVMYTGISRASDKLYILYKAYQN